MQTSMKFFCLLLVLASLQSYAQQANNDVPVKVFSKKGTIDDFNLYLVNNDTVRYLSEHLVPRNILNNYSVRVCYKNHYLLIPTREDSVEYIHIYLDRKSFKQKTSERITERNIFRKTYYIDFGLNVLITVTRSNKKYCEASGHM